MADEPNKKKLSRFTFGDGVEENQGNTIISSKGQDSNIFENK